MSNDIQNSLKVYELFRDRIKHQDTLMSYRVGYFLAMQAAIVAALKLWPPDKDHQDILWLVDRLLPMMGWVLAYGLLFSIYFAFCSIEYSVELYARIDRHADRLPGVKMIALAPAAFTDVTVSAAMPPLRSGAKIHVLGHAVPWLVVVLSLTLWPLVLAHSNFTNIVSGQMNGYWYVPATINLVTLAWCFIDHVARCVRNDKLGLTERARGRSELNATG
jgi:hypothetical protein